MHWLIDYDKLLIKRGHRNSFFYPLFIYLRDPEGSSTTLFCKNVQTQTYVKSIIREPWRYEYTISKFEWLAFLKSINCYLCSQVFLLHTEAIVRFFLQNSVCTAFIFLLMLHYHEWCKIIQHYKSMLLEPNK